MEQTIRVRSATVQDLDALSALAVQVQELHAEGRPDLFRSADEDELRRFLEERIAAGSIVIVAQRADAEPEGYVFAEHIDRQESSFLLAHRSIYIHHIAVDRSARRSGIGDALMDEIADRAREAGAATIRLDSWAFNSEAHSFFAAQGFAPSRQVFERLLDENAATPG